MKPIDGHQVVLRDQGDAYIHFSGKMTLLFINLYILLCLIHQDMKINY